MNKTEEVKFDFSDLYNKPDRPDKSIYYQYEHLLFQNLHVVDVKDALKWLCFVENFWRGETTLENANVLISSFKRIKMDLCNKNISFKAKNLLLMFETYKANKQEEIANNILFNRYKGWDWDC